MSVALHGRGRGRSAIPVVLVMRSETGRTQLERWKRQDTLALAVLCGALFVLVALAWPAAEAGVHDEPAFVNLAFRVSKDWQLAYDQFMLPIAAVQGYWPAPIVRVFGESFTLVRLCFLPFAFGVIWVQYWFCREVGLDTGMSAMATATVLASPLFLPLATTAMTDIPTLFLSQACMALAYSASSSDDRKRFLLLLSAAAAAGFMAGANRQVFWAVPALAIPGAALCQWRRMRCWRAPAAIWLLTIAAACLLIRWHSAQPDVLADAQAGILQSLKKFLARLAEDPSLSLQDLLRVGLTLSLLSLPALVPGLGTYLSRRWLRAATAAAIGVYVIRRWGLILAPWMTDMVNQYVMLPPFSDMVGGKPEVFPLIFRSALTAGLLATLSGWAVRCSDTAGLDGGWRRFLNWPESRVARYCAVTVPCALAYLTVLMLRFPVEQVFDRYLLPVTCVALPLLFTLMTEDRFGRWRKAGWLAVAGMGLYGLVFAHDQFVFARARIEAGDRLMAAGIPRTCIGGGYEFDAWTQFRAEGRFGVAEQRSQIGYWLWTTTPAVWPHYVVAASPVEPLRATDFEPVAYRTWAPPFERRLYLLADDSVPCPDRK